jgi:hypothetical protein
MLHSRKQVDLLLVIGSNIMCEINYLKQKVETHTCGCRIMKPHAQILTLTLDHRSKYSLLTAENVSTRMPNHGLLH